MNFEEMRSSWLGAEIQDGPLGTSNIPERKTNSAVAMVRRNMKAEFIATIIGFSVFMVIFIILPKTPLSVFIVCIATFVWLIQSVYYFLRFQFFYKTIGRYDLGIRRGLRKIVYELELNIEVYRTYSYCVMPIASLAGFAIFGGGIITAFTRDIVSGNLTHWGMILLVCLVVLISQAIGAFFLEFHIRLQYGRHLAELRKIVDELEQDEYGTKK